MTRHEGISFDLIAKAVLRIRIRDPVPFWPLDPGSGIGFFRILDPGFRIPNPYFWELSDNFLGKKFYNSLKIDIKFFLPSLLLLFLDPGSGIQGIRDPRSGIQDPGSGMGKNQDPGSGINIPDPPHCAKAKKAASVGASLSAYLLKEARPWVLLSSPCSRQRNQGGVVAQPVHYGYFKYTKHKKKIIHFDNKLKRVNLFKCTEQPKEHIHWYSRLLSENILSRSSGPNNFSGSGPHPMCKKPANGDLQVKKGILRNGNTPCTTEIAISPYNPSDFTSLLGYPSVLDSQLFFVCHDLLLMSSSLGLSQPIGSCLTFYSVRCRPACNVGFTSLHFLESPGCTHCTVQCTLALFFAFVSMDDKHPDCLVFWTYVQMSRY